jgi:hypothetical protein
VAEGRGGIYRLSVGRQAIGQDAQDTTLYHVHSQVGRVAMAFGIADCASFGRMSVQVHEF